MRSTRITMFFFMMKWWLWYCVWRYENNCTNWRKNKTESNINKERSYDNTVAILDITIQKVGKWALRKNYMRHLRKHKLVKISRVFASLSPFSSPWIFPPSASRWSALSSAWTPPWPWCRCSGSIWSWTPSAVLPSQARHHAPPICESGRRNGTRGS